MSPHNPFPRLEWLILILAPVCLVMSAGCSKKEAQLTSPKPVEVVVTKAVVREVVDHEDFTGRIEAEKRIDIRAQVKGILKNVAFREGDPVKKGDPLFEIDPLSYQVQVDWAEANVTQAMVRIKRLKADYERAKVLRANRSIGAEEFDKIAGDYHEAASGEKVALASREVARVNLTWTKIFSPIDGVASRSMLDPGNFVEAEKAILTTIVSQDPVYAYFDVDERTHLRVRRLIEERKMKSARDADVTVQLALSDEDDFKHLGTVNFVDNVLNPATGTKRLRAVFANSSHLLSPGLFVRLRVPIGMPHTAVIVPEVAVGSDQGQKYVYVVDADNVVSYRKVKTGSLIKTYRALEDARFKQGKDGKIETDKDGKKTILEGLLPGEQVVTSGLQRVRQLIKVVAKLEEIPADAGVTQMPVLLKSQVSRR